MREYSESITYFCHLLGKSLQTRITEQDLILLCESLLGKPTIHFKYKHNPFDPKRILMDIYFGDVHIFSMYQRDIYNVFKEYVNDLAAKTQDPEFSGYIKLNPFQFIDRLYTYHISTLDNIP